MTTPNLGLETVPANSLQPSVPINDSLQALDALVQLVAIALVDNPPATTAIDVGKRWLVATAATGDWAGKDGNVALCTAAGEWRFFVPDAGWSAGMPGGSVYGFDGAAWRITAPALADLIDAANDGAASTAGVPVGGRYRNGSVLMIRVA